MLNIYAIKRWFYQIRKRIFTTSINRAIYSNNLKKLDSFLNDKKDLDRADRFSYTPLLVAAVTNNYIMFRKLIEAGADYKVKTGNGKNLLMYSLCTPSEKYDFLEYILQLKLFDVDESDNYDLTPLISACENGKVDIVNLLIKNGANINYKLMPKGLTPLILTIIYGGHLEVVKLLLDNHVDLNVKDNEMGMTPLMQAASRGYAEIVKELVEHGADMTLKDNEGRTALTWAKLAFKMRIVNYLKEVEQAKV